MLFKDFVNSVLMEMGEYSNSGSLISESENKDYLLAITRLTNDSMISVATLGKTNTKNQNISHLMPENQLGFSEWNEELFHNDTDIIFSAVGSRYYSFQVGAASTIHIEEDISGVWTNITTINHVPTVSGYQTLYGTITPSNIANTIRLRFSGAYYYPFRWIALFKENLSTTVKYEPYVPYSTPVDFYVLDSVDFLHANRQYESYGDYKFNNATKEILFNWYTKGEFSSVSSCAISGIRCT